MKRTHRLFPIVFLFVATQAVSQGLTYENWAQGFFTHNCLGCHNSNAKGDDRFEAPRAINFDTLESIRENEDLIRDVATGDNPSMPPAGVVWWWDRVSLKQWLDAGMPGEADSLHPVTVSSKVKSLSYQPMGFQFGYPVDDNENGQVDGNEFNHRYMTFYPEEYYEFEGMILERSIEVQKREDGSLVMLSLEWFHRNQSWSQTNTRLLQFNPPVPIFFGGPETAGQTWQSAVTVRERYWDGWWGGEPEFDQSRSEQWLVQSLGVETLDNGVILPPQAMHVRTTNQTEDVVHDWWWEKGVGLARRETSAPSADYVREVTREMNIITTEYPLYGPHTIEAASQEWIPFVGRWDSYSYWYDFDLQTLAVLDGSPDPTPTASPTLAYDPVDPEVPPTATSTPFPSGLPPLQPTRTPTKTLPPQPTSTQPGNPGGDPSPTMDPSNPSAYDHNGDLLVGTEDLLMFLQHWHLDMKGGG